VILVIDNYDSFVFNLVQDVERLGERTLVRRNDDVTLQEIERLAPSAIIISPGPSNPARAGVSVDVIRRFGASVPILGVCLGHQCIGAAFGATIRRAGIPMHGKTSRIFHDGVGLFAGLPPAVTVARYHSLVIAPDSLPDSLEISAVAEDGEIMAVRHRRHPIEGVQFHPESLFSKPGRRMLATFLERARVPRGVPQPAAAPARRAAVAGGCGARR
jgi:anthranilate synthase/aminodeoxychorismate synthase-like glutamine amidotransferase